MVSKSLLASSALLALSPMASADAEQVFKALRDAIDETCQSELDDADGEELILNYLRSLGLDWGDTRG